MKLIVYKLNADGTIPSYIINGGYLAWNNNGISPQDWDLVGVATDDAQQEGFANKESLTAYVESKGLEFKDTMTEEIIPISIVVDSVWAKLG